MEKNIRIPMLAKELVQIYNTLINDGWGWLSFIDFIRAYSKWISSPSPNFKEPSYLLTQFLEDFVEGSPDATVDFRFSKIK